jgi:hypothetical protein
MVSYDGRTAHSAPPLTSPPKVPSAWRSFGANPPLLNTGNPSVLGGYMNFMDTPAPVWEDNGKMTGKQLTIAVAFVTELIILGVLDLVPQWCPSYEYVLPVFSLQARTTIPVDMHCRHE